MGLAARSVVSCSIKCLHLSTRAHICTLVSRTRAAWALPSQILWRSSLRLRNSVYTSSIPPNAQVRARGRVAPRLPGHRQRRLSEFLWGAGGVRLQRRNHLRVFLLRRRQPGPVQCVWRDLCAAILPPAQTLQSLCSTASVSTTMTPWAHRKYCVLHWQLTALSGLVYDIQSLKLKFGC